MNGRWLVQVLWGMVVVALLLAMASLATAVGGSGCRKPASAASANGMSYRSVLLRGRGPCHSCGYPQV